MTVVLIAVLGWAVLCVLGLVGISAVCRSGHLEDLARGFSDPVADPYPTPQIPSPTVSLEPGLRTPTVTG